MKLELTDEYFMSLALDEAHRAFKKNEVPVGCVVVKDNKVIARSHNTRHNKKSPLGHAEVNTIKKASRKLNRWILDDCTLYVTLEPCLMCSGLIMQSRIKRVVFGASEPKFGTFGSILDVSSNEYKFNHKIELTKGILESECSKIMSDFFRNIRKNK